MKKEFTPGHFFMNRSLIWGREGEVEGELAGGKPPCSRVPVSGGASGWGLMPQDSPRVAPCVEITRARLSHGRTPPPLTFVKKKRMPVRRVMISPARRR